MWIIYGSLSGDGSPVSGRSVTRDSLMCFLSSWRDGRGTKLNAQNVKKIVPLSKYTYSSVRPEASTSTSCSNSFAHYLHTYVF